MREYVKRNVLKVSSGVANAIFVTIGIGFLFGTLGDMFGLPILVTIGSIARVLLAPALGAGIAYNMQANTLTLFAAMASSTIGGGAIKVTEAGFMIVGGDPIGALIAGVIATWIGKKLTGTSPLDMMSIPTLSLLGGGLAGIGLTQVITPILLSVSEFVSNGVAGSPVIGSSVMAVLFGLILMSPLSSAALSIALALSPMASGAMLIGTTAQYFVFSIVSVKENNLGGYIAQGLCTPKVQLPNIIKNPKILIGPTIASAICGPIATVLLGFQTIPEMGGVGFAAGVAPLWVINNSGLQSFGVYLLCGAILPILITLGINNLLYTSKAIKAGDMALKIS
ncbi:PTS transporter subunit IIC [Marinilactibacillus psychrotolerans]|uniref:PTS transporter subunit IIC n=1 Tax=Marinilactibacillus psychrotolerans TaxID=191770 RepID=A0ABW8ULR8_9LACT